MVDVIMTSESACRATSLQLAILLHMSPLLFPSCRPTTNWVDGMTDDLPIPCRPVHSLSDLLGSLRHSRCPSQVFVPDLAFACHSVHPP